jgi:hypothetical protein
MACALDIQLGRHVAEIVTSVLKEWREKDEVSKSAEAIPLMYAHVEAWCDERHPTRVMSIRSTVVRFNERRSPLS